MHRFALLLALIWLCALTVSPAAAQEVDACPHKKGWKISAEGLRDTLEVHGIWLKNGGWQNPTVLGRAVLCNANLFGANLEGANLSGANLEGANLFEAKLKGATLIEANLKGADLRFANLEGADLSFARLKGEVDLFQANLEGAELRHVKLEGARLTQANLKKANLTDARLKGADLSGANLEGAKLTNADLTKVRYEPTSAPAKGFLTGLQGLTTLRFGLGKESGLVLLVKQLQEAGLRDLERDAVYALEFGRTCHLLAELCHRPEWRPTEDNVSLPLFSGLGRILLADFSNFFEVLRRGRKTFEGAFRLVFFGLPTAYGREPARALGLLLLLMVLMTFVYVVPIAKRPRPDQLSGVFQILPEGRLINNRESDGTTTVLTSPSEDVQPLQVLLPRALSYAFYFSALSAFRIGWRDLNVGSWLTRLQAREYELRGRGWVRVVSGLQSLTSVYLIAIWALTYFGRPFQ